MAPTDSDAKVVPKRLTKEWNCELDCPQYRSNQARNDGIGSKLTLLAMLFIAMQGGQWFSTSRVAATLEAFKDLYYTRASEMERKIEEIKYDGRDTKALLMQHMNFGHLEDRNATQPKVDNNGG